MLSVPVTHHRGNAESIPNTVTVQDFGVHLPNPVAVSFLDLTCVVTVCTNMAHPSIRYKATYENTGL